MAISRKAFIEAFRGLDTGNVEINLFDEDETVRVGYIQQNFMYGKGEASKQMQRLCALADRAGITLSLYVDPGSRPNPPMSKIELLKWYRRLGFESAPGRIFYMERKPKMKIGAAQRLTSATFSGSVRIIRCSRDGDTRWEKAVWVPEEQVEAFHNQYLMKQRGPFFYDTVGEIKYAQKKPRNVPLWDNF